MSFIKVLQNDFGINDSEIQRALQFKESYGGKIETIVANLGIADNELISEALAKSLGLEFVSQEEVANVIERFQDSVPQQTSFLRSRNWFTLESDDKSRTYLTYHPSNLEAINFVEFNAISYKVIVCSESTWREVTGKLELDSSMPVMVNDFSDIEVERLKELASEAPVVNLVNALISKSLQLGASDLHIEPSAGVSKARARIDGVLRDLEFIPLGMSLAVISRIKILASMDIAEKRRPQDGKISMKVSGFDLDIRVSSLPVNSGESVVMRFLLKTSVRYELETLGISEDIRVMLDEDLKKTSGVILLTGPTGSGKTTSLYSFLNQLNQESVKIITLEDPVEYQLEGINQIQIKPDIGFDFVAGLKSILRQDPDILMLGEIRDQISAKIAMQSALTGHLVFSTLHTNDAPSAYTRLIDLGVEEFLLNAALVSIVAQRLVRRVCEACAVTPNNALDLIHKHDLETYARKFGLDEIKLQVGAGCKKCAFSGFVGRVAILEYLRVDNEIRSMAKGESFIQAARLHRAQSGVRSLHEDGIYKALKGSTPVD